MVATDRNEESPRNPFEALQAELRRRGTPQKFAELQRLLRQRRERALEETDE